jgi:hypothetical protein
MKKPLASIIVMLFLCITPKILHAQELPPTWTFPAAWESWSFLDLTNWSSDKGFPARSFTNITGVLRGDIGTEYAAVVDTTNSSPARLQYNVVETGNVTNLTLGLGAITFWFAPGSWASASTNGTGPGAWAELFSVGQWTTNASYGYWGLFLSPGGTNIYFASQNNTGSNAVYLSATIAWNTNEWHFIALSYSATNTALYLDGFLATNGAGLTVLPGTNVITNGFFIGSDSTGFEQSRGLFDDIYTFGNPIDADDAENIYDSQFYDFFLNPYNVNDYSYNNPDPWFTNGSSLMVNIASISNNLASLLMMNTSPDVLYEVQGKTNLSQPNWISEGFVYGSELTNWTPASVAALIPGNLFLRTRSWRESTGTGIPDWWWLQYFGQVTNVDAYASAAGDGYSNLQKFQMGLNPTNYYNTNPPSGFFGAVMQTTNVFLLWNPSPGPVTNYLVQRGILNPDTGNYTYTSFVLSSNATLFEDVGVVTNDNAQNNIYNLEALYAGGGITGTDTWAVWEYGSHDAPPYAPPMATNVWANPDATGTNLLISWAPAQGPLTNYIIERGIYNSTNFDYDFFPITVVSTNTNSVQVLNEFTNTANWNNIYGVVAAYAGGVLSKPAVSTIEAGSANGPAAPTGFSGYVDSTGTNAWLTWDFSTNATGYIIYRGVFNNDVLTYGYTQIGLVGPGTNTFESVGGATSDHRYDVYTVVAVYSGGVLSQAATPWQVSTGSPAPATLYAYVDSTGTNVILAWSASNPGATGYVLSRSINSGGSFSQIAQVGSSAATYEDTNGATLGDSGLPSLSYEIQTSYPHGGLSAPSWASVASTPPPPTGLTAIVDSTGTNVLLSWQAALGAVSDYTVERGTYNPTTDTYTYTEIGTTAGTTFEDDGAFSGGNDNNDVYEVLANGVSGQTSLPNFSHVKVTLTPSPSNFSITAQLIRNEQGRWELMFSAIPTNVQTVAFYWYMYDYWDDFLFDPGQPFDAGTYIPVSEITNGVYPLSDAMLTNWFGDNSDGKVAMVQAIGADGTYGNLAEAGFESYDSPVFVDARIHMKQNLLYELRAATLSQRNISFSEGNVWGDPDWGNFDFSITDTNSVESSFFHFSGMSKGYGNFGPVYLKMDNVWPITANYELHHGLYDTNYSGPSDFNWQPQGGYYTYNFSFQGPLTNYLVPPVLEIIDPYWISQSLDISGGLTFDPTTGQPIDVPYTISSDLPLDCDGVNLYYESGAQNLFGLGFNTALVHTGPSTTLATGSSIAVTNVNCFYSQTTDPTLTLTNYYFAPVVTPGTALVGESPLVEPYPLPALNGFSNTNQTGLIVASVGNPIVIGGWARFAISNGSPTKFAYLGQYFDTNSFFLSNGIPVSGNPGVISPYGEFFPTQPGTVVLSTMPDIDTEDIGLADVRVIALNVDANHDRTMDFTYNGPDFVSVAKPFRFWVNDNQDWSDDTGDGIPGKGAQADGMMQVQVPYNGPYNPYTPNPVSTSAWIVHGRRDLVDFFPVCVNIGSLFQSNALSASISATDTNYQFILSQADGILRFAYTDLTPTNYMNFLLDTNESGKLAFTSLTTITNVVMGGVPLSQSFIAGIATNNEEIILVEAAAPTTQPLVLTIYHGTNQIAQAQLPLSISGVEQMFRHKNLVSEVFPNLSNPGPGDRLTDQSVPNEPDTADKNFVFVHGYNVNPDQARGNASDVFKRMYWAGSHAKFYGVTWYAYDSQVFKQVTINLETNIVHAFETAPHLAEFIAGLNGPTTVAAHSLGNMAVLSALSDYSAPISNYFMLDAALAIEALDGSIGRNSDMIPSQWSPYTNGLYASEWHNLFSNDFRQTLTWRGRFQNLGNTEVYNFYSSGEEVLREWAADPPTDVLSDAVQIVVDKVLGQTPVASFLWVWQEKSKGQAASDGLLGSTHGGWKFNTNYSSLTPAQAALLPDSQLRTNAFFDFASPSFPPDVALQGPLGNAYAYTYRNRILSDAIPAQSWAIGSHAVPRLSPDGEPTRNFDMQATYENGWPSGRGVAQWPPGATAVGEWHHSDYREIAFPFTYKLFDQFVEIGDLK